MSMTKRYLESIGFFEEDFTIDNSEEEYQYFQSIKSQEQHDLIQENFDCEDDMVQL